MSDAWFKVGDTSMQWLPKSPSGKVSLCDQCRHAVYPQEKRLRVDNGMGKQRKGGKGKRHSYVCITCALDFTGEADGQT